MYRTFNHPSFYGQSAESTVIPDEVKSWYQESGVIQQTLFNLNKGEEFISIPKQSIAEIRDCVSAFVYHRKYEDLIEFEGMVTQKSIVDHAVNKLLEPKLSGDGPHLLLGCIFASVFFKNFDHANKYLERPTIGGPDFLFEKSLRTHDYPKVPKRTISILKTKKPEDQRSIFYEVWSKRVYYGGCDDWEKNNQLPPCFICYPKDGIYRSYPKAKIDPLGSSTSQNVDTQERVILNYRQFPLARRYPYRSILIIVDILLVLIALPISFAGVYDCIRFVVGSPQQNLLNLVIGSAVPCLPIFVYWIPPMDFPMFVGYCLSWMCSWYFVGSFFKYSPPGDGLPTVNAVARIGGFGILGLSAYRTICSVCDLCDRYKHDESCKPFDSKARKQWMKIVSFAALSCLAFNAKILTWFYF